MSEPVRDNGYKVVATIREGRIVSTITSRIFYGTPRFSFSILKEYEREGEKQHTRWMELVVMEDLNRVLEKTRAYIEKEMAKYNPPGDR